MHRRGGRFHKAWASIKELAEQLEREEAQGEGRRGKPSGDIAKRELIARKVVEIGELLPPQRRVERIERVMRSEDQPSVRQVRVCVGRGQSDRLRSLVCQIVALAGVGGHLAADALHLFGETRDQRLRLLEDVHALLVGREGQQRIGVHQQAAHEDEGVRRPGGEGNLGIDP